MMRWIRSSFLMTLLVPAVLSFAAHPALSAEAGFVFKLDPELKSKLNDWELGKLTKFLVTAEAMLPSRIRNGIGRPITVKFVDFKEDLDHGRTEILLPTCSAEGVSTADGERQTSAQVRRGIFSDIGGAKEILLNRLYLQDIFRGPENSRTYSCGHHTAYRLAVASLGHEASHIWDYKFNASQDDRFLNLLGFRKPWLFGTADNKNHLSSRSPDSYEFENEREAFAVNLEFFELDKEMPCRKPSVYRYYQELFGDPAYGKPKCRKIYSILVQDPTTGRRSMVDIDPGSVAGVDFLLADRGKEVMSGWGHAMFRIIVCRPGRPVGSDCRKDLPYHVVVGYRANLNDVKLSGLKGLMGGYPSQVFPMTMAGIIREYNRGERRDLLSWPIELSEKEKSDFLDHTMEQFWSYEGDYKFLTNNCATEARDFVRAVSRNPRAQELSSITPVGLAEQMFGSRDSGKGPKPEIFKAEEQSLLDAFAEIRRFAEAAGERALQGRDCGEAKAYIENSTSEGRTRLYEELARESAADPRQALRLAASFFILEGEIHHHHESRFHAAILRLALQLLKERGAMGKLIEKVHRERSQTVRAFLALPQDLKTRAVELMADSKVNPSGPLRPLFKSVTPEQKKILREYSLLPKVLRDEVGKAVYDSDPKAEEIIGEKLEIDAKKTIEKAMLAFISISQPARQLVRGYGIAMPADQNTDSELTLSRLKLEGLSDQVSELVELLRHEIRDRTMEYEDTAENVKFFGEQIIEKKRAIDDVSVDKRAKLE